MFFSPYATFFFIVFPVLSDTGGFLIGKKFGKHKLAPIISPKKTWEGLVGSVLFCFVYALLVFIFVEFVFKKNLNLFYFFPYYSNVFFGWLGYLLFFLLITILVALSIIGDLFFSLIKRKNKIKDYSNLLKSHGGILDRIDSWIFSFSFVGLICFICTIVYVCLNYGLANIIDLW